MENDENTLNDNLSENIDIDIGTINIEELNGDKEELPSNVILENSEELTLGLTKEQINEFYNYLSGKSPRPVFAEKFFADSESRIKESNQLTTLMSLSFVPKLLAMQQSIIDSLSTAESLKYLDTNEKIEYLKTLAAMSTKFNEIAMKYSQITKDFSGVPLIYRQLLDQLLIIPNDKLPRLKVIPKLIDLPDDIWNRIIEISNLNSQ